MQYPLKSMSLGEILDISFKVFTRNFASLAGIAVIMQAVTFGIVFVAASFAITSDAAAIVAVLVVFIPLLLVAPLTTAVSTKIIADRYLGLETGIGSAFSYAFRIFLPLLGAIFLASMLTGIGFLLLIIPGIYLMLRFVLVSPAAVVEQRGGTRALARSGELVKGSYGKVFFLALILGILGMIVQYTVALVFGEASALGVLLTQGVAAVLGAYGSTVWTITYFERRCALEGFDLQILAKSLGEEVEFEQIEEDIADSDWGTEA